MLKIIEPSAHEMYRAEINTLLCIFKHCLPTGFELSSEERAASTYIIAQDSIEGVYGGAILRKKPFHTFHEKIEALLSILHSHKRKAWHAQFCTYLSESAQLSRQDKILLFGEFYTKLYKKLMIFGKKHKSNFLVVSVAQPDSAMSGYVADWPYVVEVLPQGHNNPIFHGILDIRPDKYRVEELPYILYVPDQKVKRRPDPVNSVNLVKKNDSLSGLANDVGSSPSPQENDSETHCGQESLTLNAQKRDFDSKDQSQSERPVP
jgi:hypothetical protein